MGADQGAPDESMFGNALPQNPAEQQAQQDYTDSLLNGQNQQDEDQASRDARRLEGRYGL